MPEQKATSIDIAPNGPGGSELGRASYQAQQVRDAVIVFANGSHPTPGFTDFFQQSPIRIFPPQFILRTIPPRGRVAQGLTPFAIWVMFGASNPVKTVTVHDADGAHQIKVEQAPELAATDPGGTWVSGSVVSEASANMAASNRATTMATGEESGGGPTTMAVGEEDVTAPTTMATGEEEPGPTTMATGEEQSQIATTLAIGEEGTITTLALGEESPPTTRRLGEENLTASATELTLTTLIVGEENPTTLALGEEGTTARLGEEGMTTLALGEETGEIPVQSSPFGGF